MEFCFHIWATIPGCAGHRMLDADYAAIFKSGALLCESSGCVLGLAEADQRAVTASVLEALELPDNLLDIDTEDEA